MAEALLAMGSEFPKIAIGMAILVALFLVALFLTGGRLYWHDTARLMAANDRFGIVGVILLLLLFGAGILVLLFVFPS